MWFIPNITQSVLSSCYINMCLLDHSRFIITIPESACSILGQVSILVVAHKRRKKRKIWKNRPQHIHSLGRDSFPGTYFGGRNRDERRTHQPPRSTLLKIPLRWVLWTNLSPTLTQITTIPVRGNHNYLPPPRRRGSVLWEFSRGINWLLYRFCGGNGGGGLDIALVMIPEKARLVFWLPACVRG